MISVRSSRLPGIPNKQTKRGYAPDAFGDATRLSEIITPAKN